MPEAWESYNKRRPEVPYGPPCFLSSDDGEDGVVDETPLLYSSIEHSQNTRSPFTAEEAALIVEHAIIPASAEFPGRKNLVRLALSRYQMESLVVDAYGTVRAAGAAATTVVVLFCARKLWRLLAHRPSPAEQHPLCGFSYDCLPSAQSALRLIPFFCVRLVPRPCPLHWTWTEQDVANHTSIPPYAGPLQVVSSLSVRTESAAPIRFRLDHPALDRAGAAAALRGTFSAHGCEWRVTVRSVRAERHFRRTDHLVLVSLELRSAPVGAM